MLSGELPITRGVQVQTCCVWAWYQASCCCLEDCSPCTCMGVPLTRCQAGGDESCWCCTWSRGSVTRLAWTLRMAQKSQEGETKQTRGHHPRLAFFPKWCHQESLCLGDRLLPTFVGPRALKATSEVSLAPCRALWTQEWIRPGAAIRELRMSMVVGSGVRGVSYLLTPHADPASAQASPRPRAHPHVLLSPCCGPGLPAPSCGGQ